MTRFGPLTRSTGRKSAHSQKKLEPTHVGCNPDFANDFAGSDCVRQYAEAGPAFARSLSWDSLMPKSIELIGATTGLEVAGISDTSRNDAAPPNC